MKLRKAFPWALVGLLVATLVFIVPHLGADSGPPSGIFSRPEPAAPIDSSAGILPPGTVVEPVVIQRPADDGRPVSPAGLVIESDGIAPAQAEQAAAPELTAEELKAAGVETR